jgi:hypothetical protein
MTTISLLRAVLVIVCASHLVLGAVAFLGLPDLITSLAAVTYGAEVTLTPPLLHAARILGAFMLAIGIMAGFALRDPVRNRAIIDGIGILQCLRVAQRLIFASQIQEVFAVSPGRLFAQSLFFLLLGVVLLALRPRASAAEVHA